MSFSLQWSFIFFKSKFMPPAGKRFVFSKVRIKFMIAWPILGMNEAATFATDLLWKNYRYKVAASFPSR
jgi:hypothetical protein